MTLSPTSFSATRREGPEREITLLDVAAMVVRHWRLTLGLPIAVAAVTALVSLSIKPSFTASTTFLPEAAQASRLPPGLAGLAGQFGISLGSEAAQSPRFYADVLKSRALLERALESRFAHSGGEPARDSTTLLDILNVEGRGAAERLSNGVVALRRRLATQVNVQTAVVQLSVTMSDPSLAAAIANRLIEYLNNFNTQTRQSQARERRKFVEQRADSAEVELRRAEETLGAFYDRNRAWQQSPQLRFEEGRLRRQVDIRQEVYLTLRREYETARIQEVNDAPVITVIEAAVPPQLRSRPRRTLMVALGFLLGGILGFTCAFGAEYVARVKREDRESYANFAAVISSTKRNLARFVARVIPTRSSRPMR